MKLEVGKTCTDVMIDATGVDITVVGVDNKMTHYFPLPQPLHIHVYVPVQDSLCTCAYYCACGAKLGDATIEKII